MHKLLLTLAVVLLSLAAHAQAPAAELMMGMGRNVQGGKVREYEFTLLRQEPNGDILYVASPSKQTETAFKLT